MTKRRKPPNFCTQFEKHAPEFSGFIAMTDPPHVLHDTCTKCGQPIVWVELDECIGWVAEWLIQEWP